MIVWLTILSMQLNAQVSVPFNTVAVPTTEFVGWDNSMSIPLTIKTVNSYNIEFFTNSTQKMTLMNTGELGIGTTTPASWLHVAPSGSSESFRTVSSGTNIADMWRMFRGTQEMANLGFATSANAFNINATRGPLRLASGNTGGTLTEGIEIVGGTAADRGWVGIGDWGDFDPLVDLHIHGRTTSDFGIQLTNNTVGINATDGLRLIMNNSGRVTMYNWEDDDIAFGTGNAGGGGSLTERLIISNGQNYGRVGIGGGAGAQLDVYDATDLTTGGDDIGFQVDERLQATNTANRGIGAELYTLNGTQTIGISNTLDNYNTTNTSGVYMAGLIVTVRDRSNTSYTDYAEGVNIAMSTNSNFAEHKTGIYAVVGESGTTVQNTLYTYGCNFLAQAYNGTIYGGKFDAIRTGGTGASYGVWASAPVQACSTGGCAGAAGFFAGELYTSGAAYLASDLKVKDQIAPLLNSSAKLALLQPKQYVYKSSSYPELNLSTGLHYGFIAQEIETVLPELVKEFRNPEKIDSAGNIIIPSVDVKSVNYTEIIPLLVNAFNEQKLIIDSLINALQNPTPIINPISTQKVSLSNINSIILFQNDPNPFTESTNITYSIPDDVNEAKIIFTNSTGVIINTVIINERGAGQLEVYSSELSKGLYHYTLVCDGKVIATKKMVKQ